ncbi:phosphoesterase family-domain-containing protein [Dipodascopsis uninucleata]
MYFSPKNIAVAAAVLLGALPSSLGNESLKDVKHIIMFMQENRAFDHYFGTMAGVRGFKDPNVLIGDNGLPIWYQPATEAEYLLPFYMGANSSYKEGIQCADGGSNDWIENHNAWNNGKINGWVTNNSEYAWGHYRRDDIPLHFALADEWTLGDMYSEFVIGPTAPNRAAWVSGNLNIGSFLGNPESVGGPYIENYSTDGECESDGNVIYDCYPLTWKTMAENLEDNDISWFVYRDWDSTNDDPFYYFANFLDAESNSSLAERGISWAGRELFYEQCQNNTLPTITWIIGSFPLSEHPPNTPHDGGWILESVVNTLMETGLYDESILLISYDETGGWGDHVPPFISPNGTDGEWSVDYRDPTQYVPSGPGFRVPFFAISPWSRGGKVFTEPADHTSQLLFLEEWGKANGYDLTIDNITPWRRAHMSNLVNMFDFQSYDSAFVELENVTYPAEQDGTYVGATVCSEENPGLVQPPIPYGNQTLEDALWTESGYKQIIGKLTEGRYLVFTNNNHALTVWTGGFQLVSGSAPADYSLKSQRFVVHQIGDAFSTKFYIQSVHGGYLNEELLMVSSIKEAAAFNIDYSTKGYTIKSVKPGLYVTIKSGLAIYGLIPYYYNIMSVAYDN